MNAAPMSVVLYIKRNFARSREIDIALDRSNVPSTKKENKSGKMKVFVFTKYFILIFYATRRLLLLSFCVNLLNFNFKMFYFESRKKVLFNFLSFNFAKF